MASVPVRARHALNPAQQAAFEQIREAILTRQFRAFLLHGVTGSGKTEVYLTAIEAVLAQGRSALLLVPEIALTRPWRASSSFDSATGWPFLHSAFTDVERTEQCGVSARGKPRVVGTRSGVFAPVRDLGLIVVDERARRQLQAGRKRRATTGAMWPCVRAQQAGAVRGAGFGHAEPRKPLQRGAPASIRCWNCRGASRNGPCPWSN